VGFIRMPIPKKSITTNTMKAIIVLFIFIKSYFSVLYVCYCSLETNALQGILRGILCRLVSLLRLRMKIWF
jgi:hypothetical protein